MTKPISKLQLFEKGWSIFSGEFFYLLKKRGLSVLFPYLRLLKKSLENESVIEYDNKAVIFFLIPPVPSPGFRRHLRLYTDRFILKNGRRFVGQAFIAVNRKCPFNCWYCSSDNTPDNELTLSEIDKIINLFKEWGVSTVVYTGGEPLLREDIDDLISNYSKELTFVILTSGYGLDPQRAKRLKKMGLFAISISLDHYKKEINDKSRGLSGAFDISLKAIKNAKNAGLYTVVQTVASDELLQNNNLWHFIDFIKGLEVDELFLLEPLCTGRLFDAPGGVLLENKEIERLKSLHCQASQIKDIPKVITSSHIEDPHKYGCGAGTEHIYVDTEGNLWPCNFLPISLGNILKEPEFVQKRLHKYFNKPCGYCILKKCRQEFLRFYKGHLPIPFESIEGILKKRLKFDYEIPEFFKLKGVSH